MMNNHMNMAGMNAVGGGPVGGNVLLMNDGSAAPTPGGSVPGGTGDMKTRFNTHIYDYFLKNGYFDCARALMGQDGVQLSTAPRTKNSPGRRRDGDMNGVDDNSMDMDSKDDITSQYPDDLPRPSVGGGGPGGSAFLFDWYCLFWDIFSAQRQRKGGPDMGPAPAYIQHTQVGAAASSSRVVLLTVHSKSNGCANRRKFNCSVASNP